MRVLELYIVIVVHLGAVPAILYPLVYTRLPWSSGATGRALMHKAMAVALLYAISILGFWIENWVLEILYAAVVTYVGIAITYQFAVMLRRRREGRALQEPGEHP